MKRLIVLLLVMACAAPAPAQNAPADIRIRLAQSYEKSEDYESAIRVYGELLTADSTNYTVIEALKRCNLKLKRYDEVIALVDHGLRLNPHDLGALAQLGNVWFLKGDEVKAADAWARAVALEPGEETTYRVVGASMVQVRQFERAIDTYIGARKSLGKPTAFAQDVAFLYGTLQKYKEATNEYLTLLRESPTQLGYIQTRLAAFTGTEAGLREATAVVTEAVKATPRVVELHRLRAWLSMEGRDYDAAYETYRTIDDLTAAQGRELFGFAERALNEKGYTSASKAYAAVIERNPNMREMPRVRLGLARSLEELAATPPKEGDTSAAARYAPALEMYRKIILEYPSTDVAAQALYRIALVKKDRLGDPTGAKEVLERFTDEYRIFQPVATQSKLLLGEVRIELGDLDRAATVFNEVAGPPPFAGPDREKAAMRLAEVRFYKQDYKGATEILGDLVKNAVSDAANDAIPLNMLISEFGKSDPEGLKAYSTARLFRARRLYNEALAAIDEAARADTARPMMDRFAFMRGEILSGMPGPAHADGALASYTMVIDRYPESLLRDRAMFAVAGILEAVKADKPGAIQMYERLIEKYPNSIHANAARRRIRELRGDNI